MSQTNRERAVAEYRRAGQPVATADRRTYPITSDTPPDRITTETGTWLLHRIIAVPPARERDAA